MNTEALFLFLILLLGLVLCSFLGGKCNKEGFNSFGNLIDEGLDDVGDVVDTTANAVGSVVGATANAANTVIGGTANAFESAANSLANGFDNYNHYSGNSTSPQLQNGMIFTDSSGDIITVITNSNGTQSLQITPANQSPPMVLYSTPPASYTGTTLPNTFYSTFGGITGTVSNGNNGLLQIQVSNPYGLSLTFVQQGTPTNSTETAPTNTLPPVSSTQYYGSTGYPIQPSGYSLAYQGPYGGSAGSVTGPNGNTAYYAQGPNGNTYAGTSNNGYGNTYYSTLPAGIPASQIPPGQEDLYILKSEIVPPVCPVCPTVNSSSKKEKCPPCPACARCPEPSFECKKVPNYNSVSEDFLPSYSDVYGNNSASSQYSPQPVVSDFSQFGM